MTPEDQLLNPAGLNFRFREHSNIFERMPYYCLELIQPGSLVVKIGSLIFIGFGNIKKATLRFSRNFISFSPLSLPNQWYLHLYLVLLEPARCNIGFGASSKLQRFETIASFVQLLLRDFQVQRHYYMQVNTVIEYDVMTRKGPKMSGRCVFLLDLCRYYLYLISIYAYQTKLSIPECHTFKSTATEYLGI